MKKIITILFVMVSVSLMAQPITQTIRGKVIDKDSKQTLPGATIVLQNSDPVVGVTSDANGEFIIKNVTIGRQSLSISFMGYHSAEVKNLLLQSGKESVVEIELIEKIESLKEVEIKASADNGKAMNEMAPVSARSFSIEQTERFAGSLGDPARMVGNYAGVVMQNDARNDIIIRGNSPIGVIWRFDDIEIPNPNHFGALGTTGGPVSMLNNNLLTNSDFFTGAFPAEFGNGISGAFDLRMRSGNNQKTEFTGQIGFNGFEFGMEGPFSKKSKASYIINARYSTLALMHEIGFGTGTGSAVPYY
ncbi:MAG: carboxypeptidase-like regulatory domain-containing protein, partial [Sphingobacteriia bacterium]|nr:carboxypeptidase-like regulatory domain-containing protein [Sphingobacteriia bacterium]